MSKNFHLLDLNEGNEKDSSLISEGLRYHVENNLLIDENIFRPGSTSFFSLFVLFVCWSLLT